MIELADTATKRMRGLLGRATLPLGSALLLKPCNAIHTIGMQFSIDVRFYNRQGTLLKVYRNVRPGRLWCWGGWQAAMVLECTAGDLMFEGLTTLPKDVMEHGEC